MNYFEHNESCSDKIAVRFATISDKFSQLCDVQFLITFLLNVSN